MIILHAGILGGQLHLWGEAPPKEGAGKRRKRKSSSVPGSLPYDAGAEALLSTLKEVTPEINLKSSKPTSITAWIPVTDAGLPVASTPLVAELPEPGASLRLEPWSLTALPLSLQDTVTLLGACLGKELLAPGVVLGQTLTFWAAALRFTGAMTAEQQFLPGVEKIGEDFYARWQPVWSGAYADRLAKLAEAMPQSCRALGEDAAAPPENAALPLLRSFIGQICDYLVRSPDGHSSPDRSGPPRIGASMKAAAFHSLHDQWIYALKSQKGLLQGSAEELEQLAAQVQEWRRPISLSTAAPFRLCFRLEEPEQEREEGDPPPADSPPKTEGPWYVRYLLQSAEDRSLLIPANEALSSKGRAAALLKRSSIPPKEYLLAALGQASRVDPQVESSLKVARPAGYVLDAAGAHQFLTQKAWLLEGAGFGVLLPSWWTRKGGKQRLAARAHVKTPQMNSSGALSLESIVHFEWQLALGDEPLSFNELQMLAAQKAPLVKLRGQWVELNREEIQAALEFWKKKGKAKASVRDLVQMALGVGKAPGGLQVEGVSAEGWIEDFLAQLDGRTPPGEAPPPADFHGTLRPYQVRGYSWLHFLRDWGLGACLADDMGLGKTAQVLALLGKHWENEKERPTLVVCPTSVVGNWQKEAARFVPDLPVMVHHGATRLKGPDFIKEASSHAIVLSSFSLLHRDLEILKEVPWAGVVLDEAQNIKNPETRQSRAARSLPADFRVALTGTPVENHVGDLWSIMEFLNPAFLGTQAEFKRTFFTPIQIEHDQEASEQLKRLTGPFILRRLKTDRSIISDLPEKMEMKVFCTLTREQASLYAAVVQEASEKMEESEGIQRKGIVLGTLSRLKQVCNHPAQFLGDNSAIPGRSGKLARLTEMLEEALSTGDKALIFSQFAEMGEIIRKHLQETFGREVLFLHGGVPKTQRDRMVERFQSDEGPRLFVLSLKAGGTGLNLTRANHVFHFDRWWNPAVENQATDRVFRIGQTKNVQVHKFLCAGTLEEKIDEMIEKKQKVAEHVVGAGEAWLTELSTVELKELFALRKDAVGE